MPYYIAKAIKLFKTIINNNVAEGISAGSQIDFAQKELGLKSVYFSH